MGKAKEENKLTVFTKRLSYILKIYMYRQI